MKSAWRRFKYTSISVIFFLIFIPLLVFGYNTQMDGYRVNSNQTSMVLNVPDGFGRTCIKNLTANGTYFNGALDYFVPTRTYYEYGMFYNNHPATLVLVGCCGDGSCSSGIGENSSNCPQDCSAGGGPECADWTMCSYPYSWCDGGSYDCYGGGWCTNSTARECMDRNCDLSVNAWGVCK